MTQVDYLYKRGLIEKMKPCPFCGEEAEFYISPHENSDTTQVHKIICKNTFKCGASVSDSLSGWSYDYEKQVKNLVNRWNRRTP